MYVDINLNRLNAYFININDIIKTLSLENQNIVGGETYEGVYKYGIRTKGEFKNINDIENVVVALKNNIYPVKIRDIANVYEYYDDEAEIVRINGQKAVSVAITKESGANIIQISRDVNKRLETMDLPYGVYYKILFNSSDTINNSIKNVISTIWQGALIFLYISGETLNVYSAIGIIMLIGIVVNNGIVLIDYMNKVVLEENISWNESALRACKRRLKPVLMTSLTTILGMLPMMLKIGNGTEMYKPLATAVCGGLLFSTVFTLIIIPTVYSSFRNRFDIKRKYD
nr:efflux RND transporter permease subunit [Brachyspira pilosicoli]